MKDNALQHYYLRLADSSMILGHRLSEWCGHGPVLEEDIAMTNLALDLIGQATLLYRELAIDHPQFKTEDEWVFYRSEREFRNYLLCEQKNGHFGDTIARQFLFDTFHYYFLEKLCSSTDPFLVSYAQKSIKEVEYHLKHSSQWVIRLGDGTTESHNKIQESLNDLWRFTGELFEVRPEEEALIKNGIAANLTSVYDLWSKHVDQVLTLATLTRPKDAWMQKGGLEGIHSENMGFILSELQYVRRAYPDAKVW